MNNVTLQNNLIANLTQYFKENFSQRFEEDGENVEEYLTKLPTFYKKLPKHAVYEGQTNVNFPFVTVTIPKGSYDTGNEHNATVVFVVGVNNEDPQSSEVLTIINRIIQFLQESEGYDLQYPINYDTQDDVVPYAYGGIEATFTINAIIPREQE